MTSTRIAVPRDGDQDPGSRSTEISQGLRGSREVARGAREQDAWRWTRKAPGGGPTQSHPGLGLGLYWKVSQCCVGPTQKSRIARLVCVPCRTPHAVCFDVMNFNERG